MTLEVIIAAAIGFIIGAVSGRNSAKRWIERHCCYICEEKWRYKDTPL